MLIASTVLFGLLAVGPSHADDDNSGDTLVSRCSGVFNRCGYNHRETKTEVIPPRYERAMRFSEGLAAVRVHGRFGYIDLSGKTIIAPRFDLAGPFYQGLAEVIIDGAAGVIDRSGKLVIQPKFARAIPFTSDVVIVSEGGWRRVRRSGHERLEGLSSAISLLGNKPLGLYHIDDGWIGRPRFGFSLFETEGRGLIWATEERSLRGPWGLLRADGTWQVEPVFSHVQPLMEGRAVIRKSSENGPGLQPSGAVDREGNLVVPVEFEWLGYWSGGFALARKGGKEGLVTKDGRLVGNRYFEKVERDYFRGVGPRIFDGLKWMSVAPDGALVPDALNDAIYVACSSGLKLLHKSSGGLEVIRPDGTPAADYSIDRRHYSQRDCDRPLSVRVDGKWGFVTQDGRMITDPPSFDGQFGFRAGFAPVQIAGLWGVINLRGETTVEPQYEGMRLGRDGFVVTHQNRVFWITPHGQEIPEPVLDDTEARKSVLACDGGSRRFDQNGLWGITGPGGEIIIEPQYRAISCFRHGVAWVPDDDAKAWCPLGPNGKRRERPRCQTRFYEIAWSHHYPERLSHDPYESSVLWNRALLEYGVGRTAEPPFMIGDRVQGRGRHPAVRLR